MSTILVVTSICAFFSRCGDSYSSAGANNAKVPDFRLKDTGGQFRRLTDFKDKKATVIVFIGTQCPIANSYLPTLAELHRRFAGKGVQFLAINANDQDSFEDVCKHARERKISFPVLKDASHKGAEALGALRTPEAFLLDPDRIIRYRGRIDDQYGYTYRRSAPMRTELKDAIDELLAGKPILVPHTEVQGCRIGKN